jgi:hypothetical protein
MHARFLLSSSLVAATTLSTSALGQTCADLGIDPSCCANVCAINASCCDILWDSDCDLILAKVGCICTDVIDIEGTSAAVDTTGAARDVSLAGICDPGPYGDDVIHNTVIYRWTAPATNVYILSTCNIVNYDSRLAVMTGCDPATTIACNDDVIGTCANFSSKLSFSAEAGATYYILVGGYSEADVGTGTLTIEPFEVELSLQGAHQYAIDAGGNDHWYAKYAVGPGATWGQLKAKAEELGGTLACANTVDENRMLGSIHMATGSGARVAFGLYQDLGDKNYAEPSGGWKWVDGGALSYGSWAANEPNDAGAVEHIGQFLAYYFGEYWNDIASDAAWTHVLVEFAKPLPEFTAPANDEAAGATPIGLGVATTVSFVGATTSAQAPGCKDPMHYDRWYTFTPPTTRSYDVNACSNGFTAAIEILTPTGELVGCSGGECTSSFVLNAGTAYLVRIGSAEGDRAGAPTVIFTPTPEIVSLDAISVNFVGGTYLDGADGGRCNDTAANPAGAGEWGTLHWSNLVGANNAASDGYAAGGNGNASTNLKDGYGVGTGASVAFAVNNPWRIYSFPANDTDRMRRGYLDSNTLPQIDVTVSNVPYDRYTVVVYFGADGPDRVGSVLANGSPEVFFKTDALPGSIFNPLVQATASDAATAVRSSYAVIGGVTGSTCTISLKENGPNVGFNGFQIIDEGSACPTDLDGDGFVSAADLSELLASWGGAGGDVDGDGTTSASDLSELLAAWGACK